VAPLVQKRSLRAILIEVSFVDDAPIDRSSGISRLRT
jgi:hypothetical protein